MILGDQTKTLAKLVTGDLPESNRVIPKNVDAEQALLGAILANNQAIEKVEDFLEENDFSDRINNLIYSTIKKIIQKGQLADINTVKLYLENNEEFKKNGGLEYLLKISDNSISIINSKQYGEIIHDLAIRRKLISLGTDLVNNSFLNDDGQNSSEIIEKVEENLFNLSNDGDIQRGPKSFEEILSNAIDHAEKAYKKSDEVVGIKSGLSDFDKKIPGLKSIFVAFVVFTSI